MPITVHPITHSDIPSAALCIQIAFASDPYNNWVFDKTSFNATRNLASLKARCEWGIRNALFYVAKDGGSTTPDEVLGVSMWLGSRPVDGGRTWSEYVDEWVLYGRQSLNLLWYRGRGGLRLNRYRIWKARQAEAQKVLWTDPLGYYFCNIVVVKPELQGKGVGRKLFEVVLERADQEGRRCYLESSRDVPNVAIYEKLGFKMVRRMRCEDQQDGTGEGCDLFCMIREPKG